MVLMGTALFVVAGCSDMAEPIALDTGAASMLEAGA